MLRDLPAGVDFNSSKAMSFQSQLPQVLRFGVFEVNLRAGELRKSGVKLKIQEQPFQVLCMLLEHPGELVTREDLRHRLWSADTFVDFDHSVNAAIKRLRDTLCDSADAPRFIETMARRGYRFIAPVDGCSVPSEIVVATVEERSKGSFVSPWVAVALLSPIVVAVVVWAVWRYPSRRIEAVERKLTANSWENPLNSAAISPDGRYIAYADNTGMYVKLIHTGETHSVPLPPSFAADVDNWSPDGSHLLVSRREQTEQSSLWSISIFGGSAHKLADHASKASFSPDGSHIAFLRADPDHDSVSQEEWIMRSDGSDQLKIASEKSETEVGAPTWSPDSQRIAYVRTNSGWAGGISSVEVNEWQKAHAETLFSDSHLSPALLWLPDGRLTYEIGDDSQNASAWMVLPQRSSNIRSLSVRITRGSGWSSQITGSADGKILLFLRNNSQTSVSVGALAASGTRLLENKRLIMDENMALPYSWTPDNKAVLFVSNRNDTPEIFKQAIDRPLAETLVTSPDEHWVWQPRLTPDGSEILYISVPKNAGVDTPSSIFAVPIGGGTPRLVLADTRIVNVQCARNPSTVCLYSTIKGKTLVTFRFDVRSGRRAEHPQIDSAAFGWSLSPDGSQMALITENHKQGKILLRSVTTRKTREMAVKGWTGLFSVDWSADGKSLFVARQDNDGEYALLNVTLDGKGFVLLRSRNCIMWAIPAPDGNLLAIPEQTSTTNAWVVENFR